MSITFYFRWARVAPPTVGTATHNAHCMWETLWMNPTYSEIPLQLVKATKS